MNMVILDDLDERYAEKWHRQFVVPNRTCAEGLWRRTQEEKIKKESGWSSPHDQRRRMIHFFDEYDVIEKNRRCQLVIKEVYLWLCVTLPRTEIAVYVSRILEAARAYGWEELNGIFTKDELQISIQVMDMHPQDTQAGRSFPPDYQTVEITVSSNPTFRPNQHSPWDVLKSGIRTKGVRTHTPHIVQDMQELKEFAPYQIELGGGASIELGIPPLNHLHSVYYVINPDTERFVFGEDDRLLIDILTDYEAFYRERASIAYKRSLLAEPNEFYLLLARLHRQGIVVGDVITNNFDGMASLVALNERYVRKYEDTDIVPKIEFDKAAKSLLVVGSHADRRLIQAAARNHGLKVIYVDPEKYTNYAGQTIEYPLENLQGEDYLVPMTAVEFARAFAPIRH